MKKISYMMFPICCLLLFMCVGCNDKNLDSATITRDDARTGGSLSFVYNKDDRVVYVGGVDEVVQFSSADESRNLTEGCRVGFKVSAPEEEVDVSNAVLEMNGVNYSSGEFLESQNGQKLRFFNIYPLFSKEDRRAKFKITWQEGTKAQEYKIEVIEGTKFMTKDGTLD